MISDILKTKCPICGGAIYPEYLKDSAERACQHCGNNFPITFKAVFKARGFALFSFFVLPVLMYGLVGEWVFWPLLICFLVGIIGYAKLTNYRASMPYTNAPKPTQ